MRDNVLQCRLWEENIKSACIYMKIYLNVYITNKIKLMEYYIYCNIFEVNT